MFRDIQAQSAPFGSLLVVALVLVASTPAVALAQFGDICGAIRTDEGCVNAWLTEARFDTRLDRENNAGDYSITIEAGRAAYVGERLRLAITTFASGDFSSDMRAGFRTRIQWRNLPRPLEFGLGILFADSRGDIPSLSGGLSLEPVRHVAIGVSAEVVRRRTESKVDWYGGVRLWRDPRRTPSVELALVTAGFVLAILRMAVN